MSASPLVNTPRKENRRRPRRRNPKRAKPDRLEPITQAKRLDLNRPADEALEPEEVREMIQHLDFIRRFKGILRLSLNAAEDLLVNRVKPPSERGVCRHLLAKIDGPAVDRALSRDSLTGNLDERAHFLAGLVRIKPTLPILLDYLEALSALNEHRDAARGFALTVNTIDFSTIRANQLTRILVDLKTIFKTHDLVQAFFGLMASETFQTAFEPVVADLEADLGKCFLPLAAAYRYLFDGQSPNDDEDWSDIEVGVQQVMGSPKPVLASYPLHARRRLVELACSGGFEKFNDQASDSAKPWLSTTRYLFNSLPQDDPQLDQLRTARVSQILKTEHLDEAIRLLKQMSDRNKENSWTHRRLRALEWSRLERFCVEHKPKSNHNLITKGLWLDENTFVWLRIGNAENAGVLSREAKIQSQCFLDGLKPVLKHGMTRNGLYFIAMPGDGQQFDQARPPQRLEEQLRMAWAGIQLLHNLAALGIEVPDIQPHRWLWHGRKSAACTLIDFAGAKRSESSAASIGHSQAAFDWVSWVFGDKSTLSTGLRKKLSRKTPLPVLAQTILYERSR